MASTSLMNYYNDLSAMVTAVTTSAPAGNTQTDTNTYMQQWGVSSDSIDSFNTLNSTMAPLSGVVSWANGLQAQYNARVAAQAQTSSTSSASAASSGTGTSSSSAGASSSSDLTQMITQIVTSVMQQMMSNGSFSNLLGNTSASSSNNKATASTSGTTASSGTSTSSAGKATASSVPPYQSTAPAAGAKTLNFNDPSITKMLKNSDSQVLSDHSIQVNYPKGSASHGYDAANGIGNTGAEFKTTMGLQPSDEMTLNYDVTFGQDFDFKKGGKLPGLYGGTGNSGGKDANGSDGWSARIMWRDNGKAEIYAYVPPADNPDIAKDKQGTYGYSLDRTTTPVFQAGGTYHIEEHVKLNTPGQNNGQITFSVNGQTIAVQNDLNFRNTDALKADGLMFSTFFGGNDASYAASKDEHIDFSNVSVSNT